MCLGVQYSVQCTGVTILKNYVIQNKKSREKTKRTSKEDCRIVLKCLRDRRITVPQIQADVNINKVDPVNINTMECVSLNERQVLLQLADKKRLA